MNREWRNTKWVLIVLAIGLVIVVAGLWAWRQSAKAQFARVKAELIAQGAKLTIAEQMPVVDAQLSNGGEMFQRHAAGIAGSKSWWQHTCMELVAPGKAMVTSAEDPLVFELFRGQWTNNIWDILPAQVEPSRGAWVLLNDVLTNDVISFDVPYHQQVRMDLPHLVEFRKIIGWLKLAIILDLHDGNSSDAIAEAVAGVGLLARFREPIGLSQLVRASCWLAHVQAVWESLHRPIWQMRDLAMLQDAVEELNFMGEWRRAVAEEQAVALLHFDEMMEEARGEILPNKLHLSAVKKLFMAAHEGLKGGDLNEVSDAGQEFIWWLLPCYHDAALFMTEGQRWIGRLDAGLKSRSAIDASFVRKPASNWYRFSNGFGFLEKVQSRIVAAECGRSLLLAAVALERYHLLSHRYPDSLDALVPDILAEVPVDWFDGKPLRYRLEADGSYWLWSIGGDGVDDGGKPADAGEDWLKGADLVWPQAANELEVEVYLGRQRAKMRKASGSGL